MSTVTLYETNADLICAQKDDGPIWEFGPVTPDMYGEFASLGIAWCGGDWEPNEDDGQHVAVSDEGLIPVAVWDNDERGITYLVRQDTMGGAAQRYILGSDWEEEDR